MICPKCGAVIDGDSFFCSSCGAKIEADATGQAAENFNTGNLDLNQITETNNNVSGKKRVSETNTHQRRVYTKYSNSIANALKVIGWLTISCGVIVGLILIFNGMGHRSGGQLVLMGFVFLLSGIISGVMFMGFGEIISLLQEIKDIGLFSIGKL